MKDIITAVGKFLLYAAVAAGAMAIFIISIETALDRQTTIDCLKLKDQSTSGYINFYITRGEADQCNAVGIIINAPVK